jgi:hypothetical protein
MVCNQVGCGCQRRDQEVIKIGLGGVLILAVPSVKSYEYDKVQGQIYRKPDPDHDHSLARIICIKMETAPIERTAVKNVTTIIIDLKNPKSMSHILPQS